MSASERRELVRFFRESVGRQLRMRGWDNQKLAELTGLTTNEVYSISSNTWSTAAPMPTSRGEAGVVSHNGNVFVVGGSRPGFGNSTDANEEFTPTPTK